MRISVSFFCALAILAGHVMPSSAEELPLIYSDDFSEGADNWTPTDPKAWKITKQGDNAVYENLGGSKYEPPYRSPKNIALLNDHLVGDFVLTAKVQSKQEPRDHRDMCLFFGYQDPSNFYYVHLGQKTDPHANQIFLVNEAPRVAISEKASDGTPWESGRWHDVKIVRRGEDGLIEIYFDDMETPTHVAHDKTFTWGQIGIGTFDDLGLWDDVELRGVAVQALASGPADPKSLKFTKWTPDFQIPNPVALSFDSKGRAYVTETQRRKANDLDIRLNQDWVSNDLSFTSVEDKENFYREQFTPENSAANAHRVKDYTGDGIHDVEDLTALSERIHRIADEDGDGFADTIYTYAEQLNHIIGGVAGGVLFHDGVVYTCPVPELVAFRDTNGDGAADEKNVLVSGFGVHLAYAGHDMHGLSIGPDGRLYWSVGDKGIRVKTADGFDYRFPNQGGLMRCELDGTNFEVFAHGQRNIQEVAFDQYGNFFGVDNDADFAGERERFTYVEQYLDGGWRSNWQYMRDGYNPWDDDLMHVPWHEGQPRWYTPALGNYENGPAGFKFNPGTALGAEYHNYFFLTSAPRGEQWAFQIQPKGDSFAMVSDHKIAEGIPLVGLNFAPDGALYGVDWGGGYPLNDVGGIWRIDVDAPAALTERDRTQDLIREDFSKVNTEVLVTHLGWADQRVRLKAQFELVKREALSEFELVTRDMGAPQLARLHSIWGIGQLIRREEAPDETLVALFDDPDPEVRAQAIKTVTDQYGRNLGLDRIPGPGGSVNTLTASLIGKLEDPVQRVRLQALLGLGRLQDSAAADAILEAVGRSEHTVGMTYTRHASVMALAGSVPTESIARLKKHESDFVRACAVIALRRRGDEAVSAFLADKDPATAADAARAIHDDWMIPSAMLTLAKALGTQVENEAFTRRAINANFRQGDAEGAERVAAFVAAGNANEALLEAGLKALNNWTTPGDLDLVVGRYRPLDARDNSIVAGGVEAHLDRLLTSKYASVRATAMEVARGADLKISNDTLLTVLNNKKASANLRSEALKTMLAQKAPRLAEVVENVLNDKADGVRQVALDALIEIDPGAAAAEVAKRLDGDASVPVQQHAIRQLPKVAGGQRMESLVAELVAGTMMPALQLDVLEAAKDPVFGENEKIASPVKALEAEWQAVIISDPVAAFGVALEGGDARRGESVFMNHPAAQCIRCHKVENTKTGSTVGPNLMSTGLKYKRAIVLESLVDPQKVVTKGYGNISLTLKDGTTVAGVFRSEDKKAIVIRDAQGADASIPIDQVEERSPVISTMPPMGFIVQKGELRDLVAYLMSLQVAAKKK